MQDYVVLMPRSGREFEPEAIRADLLAHPQAFSDPQPTGNILIAATDGDRAYFERRRREEPSAGTSAGIIAVHSDRVSFAIGLSSPSVLSIMRDLAQKLVDELDPIIESERVGDDWTDRCAGSIDAMFEPELPRRG